MKSLIEFAISHSRTVLLLLAFLMTAGLVSYITIPKESFPDVQIPIIITTVNLEGISPEDSERLLVRPIERNVSTIEGVKEMRSNAFLGGGVVILEFDAGIDLDIAKAEVRTKVDEVKADLPDEAEEPTVEEVNLSLFPVLVIQLTGDIPERTLNTIARDIRDEIEAKVPTVLEVNIAGDREEVVEIIIDPVKLEGYGFSVDEVISFVRRNNQLISAGALDTGKGRISVKVPGLIETAEDVLNLPLKARGEVVVKFSDVATIHRTFKDPTGYARNFGEQALALEVIKRTGTNIIDTIAATRAVVEKMRKNWPKNLSVTYSQDQSNQIITMLNDLQNNLIIAVLLVMVVIVFSLGFRSALLVGLAVPGSFLIGIWIIDLMGLTVNIVVLFSLILAVGMLVDGAIIVVEYADRKMAEGLDKREAFTVAAKRMLWPVVASISTILAVFLPLLFWPGIVGQFMKFMPITLLATLSASIAMAIFFIPTIGAMVSKIQISDPEELKSIAAAETGSLDDIRGFTRWYVGVLDKALNRPGLVVGSAFATLIFIFTLYQIFGQGVVFFPKIDPEVALIKIQARGNLSTDEKDTLIKQVEERVLNIKGFKSIYTNSDLFSRDSRGRQQNITKDTIGLITLEFLDWKYRRKTDDILTEVREKVKDIPGIKVAVSENRPGPPSDKPIQLEIASQKYSLLEPTLQKIRDHLEKIPGVTAVEDNRDVPGIEWVVDVDRAQAAQFGADIVLIGSAVRFVTNGFKLDEYRPDDSREELDIIVRYPEKDRTIDQLSKIKIRTNRGLVPISSFVTLKPQPKVGQIQRTEGQRSLKVDAEVLPGFLADDIVKDFTSWLENDADIPPDVSWRFKGEEEDKQETSLFLQQAFAVAIFLIALILTTQFNSFFHTLLILSSVLMSTIGVLVGLLVMGQTFSIVMGGIGIIALAGIIVSNNIILLDTYDRLSRKLKDQREIILRTGAQRLRPVILTKLTTILGLLPIMFSLSVEILKLRIDYGAPSTQWWVQLSTAIVFGVLFASTLTLIVTPCALMLRHRFRVWRGKETE